MSTFNRTAPGSRDLSAAHEHLLQAHSHLTVAGGNFAPELTAPAHASAPDQVDWLNAVHQNLRYKKSRLADLIAELARLSGDYSKAFADYHDHMQHIPRRHPVTADPHFMKHLATRYANEGESEIRHYLGSLGLAPDGPAGVMWRVVLEGGEVMWEPALPPAHDYPYPSVPAPVPGLEEFASPAGSAAPNVTSAAGGEDHCDDEEENQ